MTSDHIRRLEAGAGGRRVTLNRPDKLNCVDTGMWRRARAHCSEDFDADASLRCIVVGGAGGKAFSVGADIAEFPQVRSNAEQARAYGKLAHGAMEAIAGCRHPVVAAIRACASAAAWNLPRPATCGSAPKVRASASRSSASDWWWPMRK